MRPGLFFLYTFEAVSGKCLAGAAYLESGEWHMKGYEESIRELADRYQLPETGVDPADVLKMCLPKLHMISEDPPGGWLMYSFLLLQARFFPEGFQVEEKAEYKRGAGFFLRVLNLLFAREREELPFDATRDFELMRPEEEAYCGILEEYRRFEACFYEEGVYAFLRLSRACTPYHTLGHVAGVHHVAMYMARQLRGTEAEVDPGLMSAAAMVHDMGKFGCRQAEARRVPYLHYYYTYQFCRRYDLAAIGGIASNHSVWDLELDNLSCESLLLIYADFRVKSIFDEQHAEHIRFWSLKDSYDIILSKLDNVDEAKRQRYARVYAKLKDFEDYLVSLGCRTALDPEDGHPLPAEPGSLKKEAQYALCEAAVNQNPEGVFRRKDGSSGFPVLMTEQELTDLFKHFAIRFNLSVMHDAGCEDRFTGLLERIRSEKDWRHVRAFLTVIGEYSVYFPQELKKRLLAFLKDMMSYQEGDIRRQAASIAGRMMAEFELKFTKEIPDGYVVPELGEPMIEVWEAFLSDVLRPGPFVQDRQIRWTGYALKAVLDQLLKNIPEDKRREVIHVYAGKCGDDAGPDVITFILIDCASQIPWSECTPEDVRILSDYAYGLATGRTGEIQAAAMWFLLGWLRQGFRPEITYVCLPGKSTEEMARERYCLRYLDARINEFFGVPSRKGVGVYELTNLYLENQRAEVPWIYKYLNLEILHRLYESRAEENERYQYASHLLHLLQFGGRIVNRLQAGEHLLDVAPHLEAAQKAEIVLELARALEISEYAVAKYIPPFLGKLLLLLSPEEQQDFLGRLRLLITGSSRRAAVAALETAGIYLLWFPAMHGAAGECLAREALGLLCTGLSHYDSGISRESLYIAGQRLFGAEEIPSPWKEKYFSFMARKILALTDLGGDSLTLYVKAAALHYIYSFIADFEHVNGRIPIHEEDRPYAFFPGTFDPFSRSHAKIVEEIRRMGYRVYLAADEFSWSKRTQPFEVRRKIIEMSTAHMEDVWLFPEEIPVNIAFPADIRRLVGTMGGRRPALAVGSDVVKHASAYRKEAVPDSVQTLPHIIFLRNRETLDAETAKRLAGEVKLIHLPPQLANISSTMIRDNVNEGREITTLVNSLADSYIHAFGLYTMEPAYKKEARSLPIGRVIGDGAVLIVREDLPEEPICGEVWYHEIDQSGLYGECGSVELAARLRGQVSGRIAVITRIEGDVNDLDDKRLTAVNEALEYFQENSFSYALCFCFHEYKELLASHGFVAAEGAGDVGLVNLCSPVVLFYDTLSAIKEPLARDRKVRLAVRYAHLSLLEALTALYPGQLVLCFESGVMNYRLAELITRVNEQEYAASDPRTPFSGEAVCVPFGKILKGNVVPGTVTKGLDTDKVYDEELEHFSISEFPGYAPLALQIRAVRSFYRPVILVDDLYHSGYRAEKVLAACREEGIGDVQLIAGVMSGRGKDLSGDRGIRVRSVYSVPNMKNWFIESDLFPFLGGDSVDERGTGARYGSGEVTAFAPPLSLPSINAILPYEIPAFLMDAPLEAVYHLSEVCLAGAKEIFSALEDACRRLYGRRLTAERLREVIAQPRHPDSVHFDEEMLHSLTSEVIAKQIKRLRRLKYPMNRK